MTWNVLCEGHALSESPEGSTVACEGALRRDLQVDSYATILAPSALRDSERALRDLTARLWIPAYLYGSFLERGFHGETWPWPPEIPWVPRLPRRTPFFAISCCLHLGATRIDIYAWEGPDTERHRMEDLILRASENGVRISMR